MVAAEDPLDDDDDDDGNDGNDATTTGEGRSSMVGWKGRESGRSR